MRVRLSSSGRAVLALALLVLTLFRDLVFRGRVLFDRDVYFYWFGQVEVFRQCIRAGSWPVWDRTMAFGQPMLANPAVEALYPWTWLSLFMDTWSFFTMFVAVHLFLSALGFFILARRFGLGRVAALVGAAVWITSGPMMSFVNLWHHFAGAALIPWVVLGAELALAGGVGRGMLIWGAASGLQLLAGSADMCVLAALPTALLVFSRLRWRRAAWRANAAVLVTAAGAAVLAIALAAAQWFPTLKLAAGSLRLGRLDETIRTMWSVDPRALIGLVLPVFPGELPLGGEPAFAVEAVRPFVASLYLGLASIPLVAAAFSGARRRWAWLGGTTFLGTLLLALGRHTWVYSFAVRLLPPLASLRYPSKVMVLVAFAWGVLVALGIERLQEDKGAARQRAAVLALAMAVLASALAFGARTSLSPILAPAAGRLAGAAALVGALAMLAWFRRDRAGPATALGLGLLAVADLFIAHQSLNVTVERAVVTTPPEVVRAILASPAPRRLFAFDYFDIVGKSYRRPSAGLLMALRDPRADVFDAYRQYGSVATSRAWGISGSFENDQLGLYPGNLVQLVMMLRAWEDTPAFLKVLRMGAVGHVVALHTEGLESLIPEGVFRGAFSAPIRLYRVPDPLPRCRVAAPGPVAVDDHQQFVIMGDPRFDPAAEVLFPPGTQPLAAAGPVSGNCRTLDFRHDRSRFEVELDAPGYVVLADSYAPEWRATLDGRPADVLRANIAFQAVAAPAGKHVLELVYRPASLIVGLWISGGALLVLAGGLVRLFAARRRGAVRDTIGAVPTRES
jgi:hypothetical protein